MKRRVGFDWFVICVHCIVFVLNLGLGINVAFIMDTWLAPVFVGYEWIAFIISMVSGLFIAIGSYGLFQKSERAVKAIRRIDSVKEQQVRIVALVILNILFIGVGIMGLAFRLQFVHTQGAAILLWIGIALDLSQPLFGLVLYPIVHPPVEFVEEERAERFERNVIGDVYDELDDRPTHERYRAATGTEEDIVDAVEQGFQEKLEAEQAQRALPRPTKRIFTQRLGTRKVSPVEETPVDFRKAQGR